MYNLGFTCKQWLLAYVCTFAGIGYCWGGNIDSRQKISLAQGDLIGSLTDLGKQTNTNILIIDKIDTNIRINAINGIYSAREALDVVLKNTSYHYKEVSQRSILIKNKVELEKKEIPRKNEGIEKDNTIEVVRVIGYSATGSRIRKSKIDAISPLDVITAEQLSRSGTQSLGDLLKFIPAVSGNSTNTAVSNGGDGTTKVALRGLPANNTLVLINGQRAVFDGLAGDSVDLNTVAPIAIENLEIYKDGASAIYGSDAIAGVVNIRMLKEYNGTKLEHYSGISDKGDIYTRSTNGLWGKSTETGSVLLSASYFRQNGLFSRERKLSNSADGRPRGGIDKRVSATPYTSVTSPDGSRIILDNKRNDSTLAREINDETSKYRPIEDGDLFDFQTQTSTISPSTRLGLYSYAQKDINENVKLSSFAIFSHTKATITLASSPIYTAFLPEPITVSQDNIYNPFEEDITDLRRRLIELNPRTQLNDAKSLYSNIRLEHTKNKTLLSANIYWNGTKAKEIRSNLIDGERLARGVGPSSGCQGESIDGCTPINLFAEPGEISESQLNFIQTNEKTDGSSHIYGLSTHYSSRQKLHNQIIDYAIGVDIRNEKSKLLPNNKSGRNTIGSVIKTPTSGKREVYEAFSELYLPIFNGKDQGQVFDIEMAMRYTKSTNIGENISPKVGFRLSLTPEILLRATYSKGFRAPSIKELNTEGIFEFSALDDPCAILSNTVELSGCLQQSDPTLNQFLVRYSGSEKLKPELSENHILGLHIEPKTKVNLSFSIDAYAINVNDIINSNPQIIVNENARTGAFSDLIERDNNGNLTLIESPFVNIGDRQVKGVDFNMIYKTPRDNLGINFNASYIHSYSNRLSESSIKEDLSGTFRDSADSGDGSIPRWKANIGVQRSHKTWSMSYALKYIGSMSEQFRKGEIGIVKRRISSWITHNMQVSFSNPSSFLYASFGVDNIFDNPPTFIASAFNDNYDARTYDLKGRYIYATIGVNF